MAGPIGVRETGIDELVAALKDTDYGLVRTLEEEMRQIGNVTRDDARQRFTARFSERTARSALSVQYSADNFETRVRGFTVGRQVSVFVGQRLRKVTGKRPDWGGEQMRFGLVPARDRTINRAAEMLSDTIQVTLHDHGF